MDIIKSAILHKYASIALVGEEREQQKFVLHIQSDIKMCVFHLFFYSLRLLFTQFLSHLCLSCQSHLKFIIKQFTDQRWYKTLGTI